MKILHVYGEAGSDSFESYMEIDGDETEKELLNLAQDEFNNWATFGFEVLDREDVPEDADIA